MSKQSKTIKVIIAHSVLIAVFFFAIPIAGKIAPNVIGKISAALANILGSGSDVIITINVIATLLLLWGIYHYRSLYNKENFIRFLLLVWTAVIPNQLYTYSGLIAFFGRISSNLFLDFAIFPLALSTIGTVIFSVHLIHEEISNYLKSTESERKAQKELRKELRALRNEERQIKHEKRKAQINEKISAIANNPPIFKFRYLICALAVILFAASLAALYYAVKQKNSLAVNILSIIIVLQVIGTVIYIALSVVKKFIHNKNSKAPDQSTEKTKINEPGSKSSRRGNLSSGINTFFTGIVKFAVVVGIAVGIIFATSGSMDFNRLLSGITDRFGNTEKDVFEILISLGFIANFIGLVFVGIVLLFGSLMIYYLIMHVIRWMTNGVFPKDHDPDKNIPAFFKTIDDCTVYLMNLISDSAKNFIMFAAFIPDFFGSLRPVVFDQDAESEYEFIGLVVDQNDKPLADVSVYYNEDGKTIHVCKTDSNGFYVISRLKASVKYLEFKKDSYTDTQMCLIAGTDAKTIMEKRSSNPKLTDTHHSTASTSSESVTVPAAFDLAMK